MSVKDNIAKFNAGCLLERKLKLLNAYKINKR
jgi:hypothetical protein